MPQTGEKGYVVDFLVVEDEGSDREKAVHLMSAKAVENYLEDHDEAARMGIDMPGLSFYMLIQPVVGGKQERAEGFWRHARVGQRVYRSQPCQYCGRRYWDTESPGFNVSLMTCADCNN